MLCVGDLFTPQKTGTKHEDSTTLHVQPCRTAAVVRFIMYVRVARPRYGEASYIKTADFVFLPVKNPPSVLLLFTTQILLYKSRPYKKSTSYEYWRWTRTDGITTYLRFSSTTGTERTVPGRVPPHTPLFELRART